MNESLGKSAKFLEVKFGTLVSAELGTLRQKGWRPNRSVKNQSGTGNIYERARKSLRDNKHIKTLSPDFSRRVLPGLHARTYASYLRSVAKPLFSETGCCSYLIRLMKLLKK